MATNNYGHFTEEQKTRIRKLLVETFGDWSCIRIESYRGGVHDQFLHFIRAVLDSSIINTAASRPWGGGIDVVLERQDKLAANVAELTRYINENRKRPSMSTRSEETEAEVEGLRLGRAAADTVIEELSGIIEELERELIRVTANRDKWRAFYKHKQAMSRSLRGWNLF